MPRMAGTSWLLTALAAGSLLCYVLVASFSEQFIPFQGQRERPILEVLACLGIAYLLYLAGVWLVYRDTADPKSWQNWIIIGAAVLFRLVQLTANPIQEIDIYRYLWDGRVTLAGVNPFTCSPQAIAEGRAPAEVQNRLDAVRAEPAVERVFQTVDHRQVPTVYPPLSQGVFALAAALTPPHWPLHRQVMVMKLLMVLFDLGTIGLVIQLLRACGRPAAWCLVYAWCPLVIKEVANSGHLDAIAVFFSTATMLLLLKQRPYFAALACTAAILSKVFPVILLPLLAAYLWRTRRPGAGLFTTLGPIALIAACVLGVYALVWPHQLGAATPVRGLQVFLTEWKMNDLLFDLIYRGVDALAGPWLNGLVADLPWWPVRLATGDEGATEPVSAAFVAAYLLVAMIWLSIALGLAWRVLKADRGEQGTDVPRSPVANERLLEGVFYTLAVLFLLSPTGNPWYLLWALPFLPWARQLSWLLLPGLVLQYYLRFWFIYQDPSTGAAFFDTRWVWIEYLPFFLALSTEAACGLARSRQAPSGPKTTRWR